MVKDNKPGRAVDLLAAQCEKCFKWRIIDSLEEFEEIRSKFIEDPFLCDRKPGISCSDPGDIEYDSTRTWVIDRPNLPKPPEGFKRELVMRKDFARLDAYYVTPTGKKMRTPNEVAHFLKEHPEQEGVSVSDFSFSTPKIMEETLPENVLRKGSKRAKISREDDVVVDDGGGDA